MPKQKGARKVSKAAPKPWRLNLNPKVVKFFNQSDASVQDELLKAFQQIKANPVMGANIEQFKNGKWVKVKPARLIKEA
jgi:hypothetical protein